MSLFSEFGKRFVEARTRQAKRRVYSTLLQYDDATIERAGFSRADLKRQANGSIYYL